MRDDPERGVAYECRCEPGEARADSERDRRLFPREPVARAPVLVGDGGENDFLVAEILDIGPGGVRIETIGIPPDGAVLCLELPGGPEDVRVPALLEATREVGPGTHHLHLSFVDPASYPLCRDALAQRRSRGGEGGPAQ